MNEEIAIRFSGDTSALGSALRGLKSMVAETGSSIKDKFRELGAGIGGHLMEAFSVGAAIAEFEHLTQKVVRIKAEAATLNVSTDFVQSMEKLGRAAGVSEEKVGDMMEKFLKTLPAGSDFEQELLKLADRIKNIPDPAERARLAIEEFGKSGASLIPILSQGSDKIKEIAAQFSNLSDEEMDAIENGKKAKEDLGDWIDKVSGKFIYGYSLMSKLTKNFYADLAGNLAHGKNPLTEALDKTTDEMNQESIKSAQSRADQAKAARDKAAAQEQQDQYNRDIAAYDNYMEKKAQIEFKHKTSKKQLVSLETQKADLVAQLTMTDNAEDFYNIQTRIEEITDKILDTKKKITEQDEKQKKITEESLLKALQAQQAALQAKFNAAASELQGDAPSLQSLAQSGYQVFRHNQMEWQKGPYADLAQKILNLRADAGNAVTWGDPDRRDNDVNQINELKKSLPYGVEGSQAEANGMFQQMSASLADMQADIADLASMVTANGLMVTGPED